MASFYRSAIMTSSRSIAYRSKTLAQNSLNLKPIASSPLRRSSRFVSVLGSVDTMAPLHSAIASSRLISSIAVDSSCWSWLSQEMAVPR